MPHRTARRAGASRNPARPVGTGDTKRAKAKRIGPPAPWVEVCLSCFLDECVTQDNSACLIRVAKKAKLSPAETVPLVEKIYEQEMYQAEAVRVRKFRELLSKGETNEMNDVVVYLADIRRGPYQRRELFDPDKLLGLARSIQSQGLINPLVVVKNGTGYQLLAGERRWRALCALTLDRTGVLALPAAIEAVVTADWPEQVKRFDVLRTAPVPVQLCETDEATEQHLLSIIDNLQREDVTPVERANEYRDLLEQHGLTVEEVAAQAGVTAQTVSHYLAILDLEPEIQGYMHAGQFSSSIQVVRALLELPGELRLRLARRFARRGASIKEIRRGCTQARIQHQRLAGEEPVTKAAPKRRKKKSRLALSPESGQTIRTLAEELCGECATEGLSSACLTCPGVIEFVEKLVALAAEAEPVNP